MFFLSVSIRYIRCQIKQKRRRPAGAYAVEVNSFPRSAQTEKTIVMMVVMSGVNDRVCFHLGAHFSRVVKDCLQAKNNEMRL